MTYCIALSALLCFALAACQGTGDPAQVPVQSSATPQTPVTEASDPEAMCAEHGVLEAVCTKCNPKLAPIFKSKGDWCAEHDFPESFCPICHPDKGGRPSVDLTVDGAPANGMVVKLKSAEVARQSGIETAEVQPGGEAAVVVATATLVVDNSKSALVNVTLPGVIRGFRVDVGASVSQGQPLALIESAELAHERASLQSARARSTVAEATYARAKDLFEKGIVSSVELEIARRDVEEASADISASLASLDMAGAGEGEGGLYELLAPIPGVVTQRHLSVGTRVDPESTLFAIVNTSVLWAEINVPEAHAADVSEGQRVVLEVDALPDREFVGVIKYVAPVIDAGTRTIKARALIDNREGALRGNMFARAHILSRSSDAGVTVPRTAVQETGGVQMVFIRVGESEYHVRRVRTLPSDEAHMIVMSGLSAGERVVTTGSFLLKTETLKGSIGAGCCEVEKPGS